MEKFDWNDVQAPAGGSQRPVPGAYAAVIKAVDDNEEKQYLKICWDYAEEPFKGTNEDCHDLNGFWPASFIKSYKPKARYFFKQFKEAVEASNKRFTFNNDPESLVGKYMAVVLGEEEYRKRDGTTGTRLYVFNIISGADLRNKNFSIPPIKRLEQTSFEAPNHYGADNLNNAAAAIASMAPVMDDDGLPF